jgi:ribosomal RNA-processing protein 17
MDPAIQAGIFRPPRPKVSVLATANRASKRRKTDHKIEEITFDNDSRADYLTGFHKRKVARAKQAKVEAEKKEKEERIQIRKQVSIICEMFDGGVIVCLVAIEIVTNEVVYAS